MTANSDKSNNWNNFEDVEAMERERPWEKDYTPPGNIIYGYENGFLIPPKEDGGGEENMQTEELAAEQTYVNNDEAKANPMSAPPRPASQVITSPQQLVDPEGHHLQTFGGFTRPKPVTPPAPPRYTVEFCDPLELIEADYTELDMIKPGFPLGTLGARIGTGGVGKTWVTLQEAIMIAIGRGGYKRGAVVYLSAEETKEAMGKRVQIIVKHMELNQEEIQQLRENLLIWPIVGQMPNLLEIDECKYVLEDFLADGLEKKKFYGNDCLRLIIFDTLRRFSFADENRGEEMNRVLGSMEHMCNRFGASCLFLHHMTKSAAMGNNGSVQQASRGSSALVDNIRYQEYLQALNPDKASGLGVVKTIGGVRKTLKIGKEYDDFIEWGVSKQNFDRKEPVLWLQRQSNGVLEPVEVVEYREEETESDRKKARQW